MLSLHMTSSVSLTRPCTTWEQRYQAPVPVCDTDRSGDGHKLKRPLWTKIYMELSPSSLENLVELQILGITTMQNNGTDWQPAHHGNPIKSSITEAVASEMTGTDDSTKFNENTCTWHCRKEWSKNMNKGSRQGSHKTWTRNSEYNRWLYCWYYHYSKYAMSSVKDTVRTTVDESDSQNIWFSFITCKMKSENNAVKK